MKVFSNESFAEVGCEVVRVGSQDGRVAVIAMKAICDLGFRLGFGQRREG